MTKILNTCDFANLFIDQMCGYVEIRWFKLFVIRILMMIRLIIFVWKYFRLNCSGRSKCRKIKWTKLKNSRSIHSWKFYWLFLKNLQIRMHRLRFVLSKNRNGKWKKRHFDLFYDFNEILNNGFWTEKSEEKNKKKTKKQNKKKWNMKKKMKRKSCFINENNGYSDVIIMIKRKKNLYDDCQLPIVVA